MGTNNKSIIGLDLNIDQDYIAEAVKQTVLMGISESLNGKNEIASQLVNMVLSVKVDEKGKVSDYERYNKYSLVEFHVRKLIEEEARNTIEEVVEENREVIKAELRKAINNKKFTNEIVAAMTNGMIDSMNDKYKTSISISLDKKEEEY
jgi:hypothetical protein